jgi:hypothetical protein
MIEIIEDCSPYYVRFTFDSLVSIIEFAKSQPTKLIQKFPGYTHEHYEIDTANKIILMLTELTAIRLKRDRAALFNTPPGGGCGIHKDGGNAKVSFNIPIEIVDKECLTHWYTDDEVKEFSMTKRFSSYSNNIWSDWKDLDKFSPAKTMTANPNEMILFNTDIYHCWSNENSKNYRQILTLRTVDTSINFEDAKQLLYKQ